MELKAIIKKKAINLLIQYYFKKNVSLSKKKEIYIQQFHYLFRKKHTL